MPKVDFNGEKQFLIDAQVYQGSSGSPVFMTTNPVFGGEVKFIGVLNAGMLKHATLKRVPVNVERFGIQQMIGLGFVLKPSLVRELVEDAVSQIRASFLRNAQAQPVVEGVEAAKGTAA